MNMMIELADAKTVGITGHVRPDGDCVGSVMATYNYIKNNMPQIEVDVYLEKPGAEFEYIKNINEIKHIADEEKIYDVFIVLDCSDLERISPFATCFHNAKHTICIDHHISNKEFAKENLVLPKASSSCEVLYGTLDLDKIDKSVAECIYTGIIHDTGVFKYSCTSSDTMEIAGKMMNKGISYSDIIDNSFYKKTYLQNKILGKALLDSELLFDERLIYSIIYKRDMDNFDIDGKQLGGIVEQLRLTENVEIAVFLYETDTKEFKVSMRSKNYVDVSAISVEFGGGGHVRAAGFTMKGSEQEILKKIFERLQSEYKWI